VGCAAPGECAAPQPGAEQTWPWGGRGRAAGHGRTSSAAFRSSAGHALARGYDAGGGAVRAGDEGTVPRAGRRRRGRGRALPQPRAPRPPAAATRAELDVAVPALRRRPAAHVASSYGRRGGGDGGLWGNVGRGRGVRRRRRVRRAAARGRADVAMGRPRASCRPRANIQRGVPLLGRPRPRTWLRCRRRRSPGWRRGNGTASWSSPSRARPSSAAASGATAACCGYPGRTRRRREPASVLGRRASRCRRRDGWAAAAAAGRGRNLSAKKCFNSVSNPESRRARNKHSKIEFVLFCFVLTVFWGVCRAAAPPRGTGCGAPAATGLHRSTLQSMPRPRPSALPRSEENPGHALKRGASSCFSLVSTFLVLLFKH
jgi:hypothetical protein